MQTKQRLWFWCAVLALLTTVGGVCAQTQSRGFPLLRNYDVRDFKTEPHNTSITQDTRGFLYAGNSKGVLVFDGVSWRLLSTRNRGLVNALDSGEDGKIYAGGFNEIGYFEPNAAGEMVYQPILSPEEEKKMALNLIWNVIATPRGVYFQNDLGVYFYRNRSLKALPFKGLVHAIAKVRNRVYLSYEGVGLVELDGETVKPVPGADVLQGKAIRSILPYREKDFLLVIDKKLYRFDGKSLTVFPTEVNEMLQRYSVYCAAVTQQQTYAFGALQGGLFVMDSTGRLTDWVNRSNGLQNNLALAVYAEPEGSLWLALDKGITRVDLPSALSHFNETNGIEEEPKAVAGWQNKLYVATNQGVFEQSGRLRNGYPAFQKLDGGGAQNWSFLIADSDLLVGSTNGVYQVKNGRLEPVSQRSYNTLLYPSPRQKHLFFSAGVAKLDAYQKTNGQWKFAGKIDSFNQEVNSMFEDSAGYLWIGSSYQGIQRIDFRNGYKSEARVERFDLRHGLPSLQNNRVFHLQGRPIFATDRGFYRFIEAEKRFAPDPLFQRYFQDTLNHIVLLHEETQTGKIWLVAKRLGHDLQTQQEIYLGTPHPIQGYVWAPQTSLQRLRRLPIQSIYTDSQKVRWFITLEGLFRYDENDDPKQRPVFRTHIRRIVAGRDSILFQGYLRLSDSAALRPLALPMQPSLSYELNTLRFEAAASFFQEENETVYSYFLEGYDENWTDWTREPFKLYTRLSEGGYRFRVRARNIYGEIAPEVVFNFRIEAPWYRTWAAIVGYLLTLVLFIAGLFRFRTAQLRVQNLILEDSVQRRTWEIKKKNAEIETQKQEIEAALAKVKAENEYRERELNDAKMMQLALMPQRNYKYPPLELAHDMKPAAEVGGDYYDFHKAKDGTLTIAVGDATGHGLKAAFIVATVKSYFNFMIKDHSMEEIFHLISQGIAHLNLPDMYMALGMLQYKNRKAELIMGGVPPVLVYRAQSRTVEMIEKYGLFLGTDFIQPYERVIIDFAPNDVCIMMTDGLAESFNEKDEFLGYQRLADYLAEVGHLPVQEIFDQMIAFGQSWANGKPFEDDLTLVVFKVK